MKVRTTILLLILAKMAFGQNGDPNTQIQVNELIISYAGIVENGDVQDSLVKITCEMKITNNANSSFQIYSYEVGSCCHAHLQYNKCYDNFIPQTTRDFLCKCKNGRFVIYDIKILHRESQRIFNYPKTKLITVL